MMYTINALIVLLLFGIRLTLQEKNVKHEKFEKCYGSYGCFNKTDFFDNFSNLMINAPNLPEKLNVTFYLFTTKNMLEPKVISYKDNPSIFDTTYFNPDWPLVFVIHGWITAFKHDHWTGRLVHKIIGKKEKVNVIAVDWHGGAANNNYLQSAADLRLVARIIAQLIRNLIDKYAISPTNIELIGHSLGGQICGFVGREFTSPKIGHIIALDPAKPYFDNDDPRKRIDSQNGQFVEVIMTNSGNMGLTKKVGHINIYPNGGKSQPGCTIRDQLKDNVNLIKAMVPTCSHTRAADLLIDDYDEQLCQPVAYACSDYDSFKKGKCIDCGDDNANCWLFGLRQEIVREPPPMPVNRTELVYYFDTDKAGPYCVNHFAVGIHTSKMQENTGGLLEINIEYENKNADSVKVQINDKFIPDQDYYRVITTPHSGTIEAIKRANVTWLFNGLGNAMKLIGLKQKKLILSKMEIKLLSLWDPLERQMFTTILCPQNHHETKETILELNKPTTFVACTLHEDDEEDKVE